MLTAARTRLRLFGLVAAAAGLLTTPLRAEKLVTVRSVADRAYAEKRAATNPPPRETYVFAKGEYSPGDRRDSSLEKTTFLRMAQVVASDLRKQNYEPTKDYKTADLIIVMHWGCTMGNDRGLAQSLIETATLQQASEGLSDAQQGQAEDPPDETFADGAVAAAAANYRSEILALRAMAGSSNGLISSSNAELLGFSSTLAKDDAAFVSSTEVEALRSMIDEERYYIILMAYDGPALRDGKKRRLWTTRMSIRSAGVNFTIAIDRMSSAAALFHGTQQTGVALEVPKQRRGEVTIGEVKVLGETEAPLPKGKVR